MNNWQEFFKGKKVTVMGLGLLGRGVGDVKFLAEQGAELIVTDLKTEADLNSSLEDLKNNLGEKFGKIKFILGEHKLEDFKMIWLYLSSIRGSFRALANGK
jgi:UDP-N-acetylmuramoylalanine--D-glutamate ligase